MGRDSIAQAASLLGTYQPLSNTDPAERAFTLAWLKTGERIAYQISGITIQCWPMSRQEKKRLAHLLNFEAGGYRLDTFQLDSALYQKNGMHYYILHEMVKRGFLPRSTIALNPQNEVITRDGQLLDIFVPLGQAILNFTSQYAH